MSENHTPASAPKPRPRPVPRSVRPAVAAPLSAAQAKATAEAIKWGRVDAQGAVWVRESAGERQVGQFAGSSEEEALNFYVRRYLDLLAQVNLFESRLASLSASEATKGHAALAEALQEPQAVGDLDSLRSRVTALESRVSEHGEQVRAQRQAQREEALKLRESIVTRAEEISAQESEKTQWKKSGDEIAKLLTQWQEQQKTGPKLDKSQENELWKRFSAARTVFDRNRRAFFAQRSGEQSQAKALKEALIKKATEAAKSTDWAAGGGQMRDLMDQWKAAGRAQFRDEQALWERFRAARQQFFDARSEANAIIDSEYEENLVLKLAVLKRAEALLPVKDLQATREALRPLQDEWDEIGRVPRANVRDIEDRMKAVESAVRQAEDEQWKRSNPEVKARATGMMGQLEAILVELEKELAEATAKGDAKAIDKAQKALDTRRAWMESIRAAASE